MQAIFKQFNEELQIAYAEVYLPNVLDTHKEFMSEETIRKMAHNFLSLGKVSKIDLNHDKEDTGCLVVESFIVRKGDPDFPVPGSWVLAVKVTDDLWPKIKSGELGGFSLGGMAKTKETEIEVNLPDSGLLKGETLTHEDHTHKYFIYLDKSANIIKGHTDEVDGHSHDITGGTTTDEAEGHSHRFSYIEQLLESDDAEG